MKSHLIPLKLFCQVQAMIYIRPGPGHQKFSAFVVYDVKQKVLVTITNKATHPLGS